MRHAGVASGVAVSRPRESTVVNGNVSAIRRVVAGDEFRSVFLACLRHAARELNQGFFPRMLPELRRWLRRPQVTVGLEDVEFGIVRP